ncbi:MAG: PhoH family protein [Candidatus Methanomethylicia archaeon]
MTSLIGKIKPMSNGQRELIEALTSREYDVVGVFGPTGTGKSLLTCIYGIDGVINNTYGRFIISRPVVDVTSGRELTAIDIGELYYRIAAEYLQDIIPQDVISWSDVKKLINEEKIVFADTHYLRGRTFDNSIVFLDDAQSVSPESTCEILMRIGNKSKLIIAGDPIFQKDPLIEGDGATLIREVLLGEEKARVIDLGIKDIVRPGARKGIKLLIETRMRKRELSPDERKVLDIVKTHAPDTDIVTITTLTEEKKKFEIKAEQVVDSLVIAKEGYLARLIGKKGERISKIEKETGMKIRAVELTLNFKEIITAIHPLPWTHKYIEEIDFKGSNLTLFIEKEGLGPILGQKGAYIRFLDSIIYKLMKIRVVIEEVRKEKKK